MIIENWSKKVNDLSGGGKQVVAILRNIIKKSDILILDEPTSNLDASRTLWLKEMIKSIKDDKIIFVITHEHNLGDIFDKVINLS